MADKSLVEILRQGVEAWNQWMQTHFDSVDLDLRGIDLSGENLAGANLRKANLARANLTEATLFGAYLNEADLSGARLNSALLKKANLFKAKLSGANLSTAHIQEANLIGVEADHSILVSTDLTEANLRRASLTESNFTGAILYRTNLSGANLSAANLKGANLTGATLVETNLSGANLTDCRIFGISAWKVNLEGAIQSNLDITNYDEPAITVDNLEVAQFVYLLLHNEKLRDVIDTITTKAVLILGRFTNKRKAVLDAIREELRNRNYVPILFDFEKPANRDLTETVSTLANLSRFIIADITEAKSIPQELQAIVPNLPSVAVQPIIHISDYEYAMFEHFKRYPWVLPVYQYETQDELILALSEKVIEPAETKAQELLRPKTS